MDQTIEYFVEDWIRIKYDWKDRIKHVNDEYICDNLGHIEFWDKIVICPQNLSNNDWAK